MKNKSILSQFKGLKLKDPGAWPAAPKMLALAVIVTFITGVGYVVDTQSQLNEIKVGKAKEVTLKTEYKDKYTQAVNLDLYRAQLVEVDEAFGSMLKQLPDRAQMEMLITDVNQAGISRELMFDLFKPGAEIRKEFYAEMPIAVQLQGTYHQMGLFASDIAKLSRIVTLNDLAVVVNKDGRLQMNATAKTYRYLDESEIAAQKAAAKPQTKKRGAK